MRSATPLVSERNLRYSEGVGFGRPPLVSVVQWKNARLLSGWPLVRIQPGTREIISIKLHHTH